MAWRRGRLVSRTQTPPQKYERHTYTHTHPPTHLVSALATAAVAEAPLPLEEDTARASSPLVSPPPPPLPPLPPLPPRACFPFRPTTTASALASAPLVVEVMAASPPPIPSPPPPPLPPPVSRPQLRLRVRDEAAGG